MSQPIQVHFAPTPNGWKITIALEEMGVPYDIVQVRLGSGDQFKPEFRAISPNGRMPALVDQDGPDGRPISVFESGAILQYLGRKFGKFYPADERGRVEVDQWVFWQMAGLGPMAGQTHHFRQYAPSFIRDQRQVAYGAIRYTNETHRLYGVLDVQLRGRDFICGELSIADFACWPWIVPHRNQGVDLTEFPDLKAWFERMRARDAVQRGYAVGRGATSAAMSLDAQTKEAEAARAILFGQRAVR